MIGWDHWSKKRVNYLSKIEGKGGGGGKEDIHCSAQNAALFVDPLKKSFLKSLFGYYIREVLTY